MIPQGHVQITSAHHRAFRADVDATSLQIYSHESTGPEKKGRALLAFWGVF
jgi:hypothetical protein